MISNEKHHQILTLLENIEADKGVNIILAVESGSRAWGFPSEDSDYDIRIIYHHPMDWYVTPFDKKKVIQDIFIDDLDVSGWDVSKCLGLMYKANASLLEWLHSPVIYRSNDSKTNLLRNMAVKTFNQKNIFYHYISFAKKKLADEKSSTNAKQFLYALRALLCAKWIADKNTPPPVEFNQLREVYVVDSVIAKQLDELIDEKVNLNEGDQYQVPKELFEFSTMEYESLKGLDIPANRLLDMDVYDRVLADILAEH